MKNVELLSFVDSSKLLSFTVSTSCHW